MLFSRNIVTQDTIISKISTFQASSQLTCSSSVYVVTVLCFILYVILEFEKMTETAAKEEEEYVVIEHYECAICSSTTASTAERPMGMVSLIQSTCGTYLPSHCPQYPSKNY